MYSCIWQPVQLLSTAQRNSFSTFYVSEIHPSVSFQFTPNCFQYFLCLLGLPIFSCSRLRYFLRRLSIFLLSALCWLKFLYVSSPPSLTPLTKQSESVTVLLLHSLLISREVLILALLAPTGALVVMMVYYTYIYQPTFSDFHSVH